MINEWELVTKWMHSKTEVTDNLTVRRVAEIMVDNNIGSVIVSSNKGELGMLTERDIMSKVVANGLDSNKILAKDITTRPLLTMEEDNTIWDACDFMAKYNIRRLPVTNKTGEIIGVLTTRSISNALPVISRFRETEEIFSAFKKMKHEE